jgi:hypothetical protein
VTTDLELAFKTLQVKTTAYTTLWSYYDGEAPLVYASERLREIFQFKESRFSENWCAVVIDSELERIHLKEFSIGAQPAAPVPVPSNSETPDAAIPTAPETNPLATALNDLFSQTELNLDAGDVHKAALVTGEAYVCAWKETLEDGTEEIEAYYHDPRMTHVFYDPEHPRKKKFAVKWWVGEEDGLRYLNLYYPDRIEYYVSTSKAGSFSTYKGLKKRQEDEENPFGIVPVFHFRTDRRKITSRLKNVIEPQDALNKLLADMMVAAEFGSFMQRWVITNSDTSALKNAPNEIWQIPAGDEGGQPTEVGQFEATQLDNYLNAIDKLAIAIGVISRTPRHYLMQQGGDPSGEALIAMEAPLNKKAQAAIDLFTPTWQELGAFLLLLNGQGEVEKRDITPVFDEPQTVQPRTEAEIRQIDVNTGIPLVTTLRRNGWSEAEITQMEADKAEEKAKQPTPPPITPLQGNGEADGMPPPEMTPEMNGARAPAAGA